ncbi:protein FAM124A isoform X2 [Nematostella vectensis]|uniref:protein FAM124A isoform X2 n=1 Tax=Nematostella vectensis TaxID=45351 RepID=UPI00207764F4|nr:protein FAM124A isoform X2 [Nematostella vectensis]
MFTSLPWYETTTVLESSSHESPNQETGLCSCTLRIKVPDALRVRELYSPLLQWIDPMFQLIHVDEGGRENDKKRHNRHRDSADSCEPTMGVRTQSLSVILFLRNDGQSQPTADSATDYLSTPPWQFHHKIELTSRANLRVVARQVFFASSPGYELPLWSVCPIHCGKEQLRFNIFVNDFTGMKAFYSALVGADPSASKPGFCVFQLYSQPGLEIQLSLKHSPCLIPQLTEAATLSFVVNNISELRKVLPNKVTKHVTGTWRTRDTDGNEVLLLCDSSRNGTRLPQIV